MLDLGHMLEQGVCQELQLSILFLLTGGAGTHVKKMRMPYRMNHISNMLH